MELAVVILAAGKGTRMKSSLPKVLHPIAGVPMVERIINTSLRLSAAAIHLVYGHGGHLLQQTLSGYKINWCEQAEQLGTGHAVMQAIDAIDDEQTVLILVGDAPLVSAGTLSNLLRVKAQADVALLTVDLADPTGMGRIIRDAQQPDRILSIVEHKDATEEQHKITEINTGMMAVNGRDLRRWLAALSNDNAQGEYYLTDIIAMAAQEGLMIQSAKPQWEREVEGINNRLQLASLERAYQQRQAELFLLDGVTIADPARFDVRGELRFGQDCSVDINFVAEGKVHIGDRVSIGPNVVIKNSVIADDVVIEANSVIDGAQVGQGATIGPFARVRPGTELAADTKIGNFVETKKATIGRGSKVNHLSYIGDARIGANVNIGAGTITCNYDGANKYQTELADGVFVGSNSSLVAPLRVGKNSTIGAGSTVTKSVGEEQLAIARGKQINLDGWQRPVKKK